MQNILDLVKRSPPFRLSINTPHNFCVNFDGDFIK